METQALEAKAFDGSDVAYTWSRGSSDHVRFLFQRELGEEGFRLGQRGLPARASNIGCLFCVSTGMFGNGCVINRVTCTWRRFMLCDAQYETRFEWRVLTGWIHGRAGFVQGTIEVLCAHKRPESEVKPRLKHDGQLN